MLDLNLKTIAEVRYELERSDYSDWLVENLVSSEATTILGDPYIGKTFLAMDLAVSLTTGQDFLGRKVVKGVERIAFLCTDPGGKVTVTRRGFAAGADPQRVLVSPFYLPETWADWKQAVALFRDASVEAIIIDNTTDLAEDANSPREVKAVTDGLRLWSENGATIINLHHRNKVSKGYFGSMMWQKWTRAELELSGNPKSNARRLTSKANDAEPVDLSLTFDPHGTPAFEVTKVNDPQPGRDRSRAVLDKNKKIAEFVATLPDGSYRDKAEAVAKKFGGSATTHLGKMKVYLEIVNKIGETSLWTGRDSTQCTT